MKTCFSFGDILEVSRPQILEMERVGNSFPDPATEEACNAFTRQVRLVEGGVRHTYGMAAAMVRKADDLNEVADVWRAMMAFCQVALETVAGLKDRFPYCGTAELYDTLLDYKLAADKRFRGVQEEIACQKVELPKGLFPELS
jgi:hypothetical protein